MKTYPCLLLAILLGCSCAGAESISGRFVDKGVVASSGVRETSPVVSLHALFSQQFDLDLGAREYAATDQLELTVHRGHLDVRLLGEQANLLAKVNWRTATYAGIEDEGLMVRVKCRDSIDDTVALLLETVENGRLLQVRVIKHEANVFGPKYHDYGTYFFMREGSG